MGMDWSGRAILAVEQWMVIDMGDVLFAEKTDGLIWGYSGS